MTFLYPLGLLGLIGIPILILIYIIKSKYSEQTVSSTYLWTLSERFLKRRNPISKLTGIISLILQLLTVAVLSLAIAHPIITVPGAANAYCFVLDGSGSMNITEGEKTRFDIGKEKIREIIDESVDGSLYSLVFVGDTTSVIFDKIDDKKRADLLLNELAPSYAASDMQDAMRVAQTYFSEEPSTITYLVTDTIYQNHENVQLVNVATSPENYGVSDITYTLSGGVLKIWGNATSYVSGASVNIELYLDGAETPAAVGFNVLGSQTPTPFQLTCPCEAFDSFEVKIAESDALDIDNKTVIFNPQSQTAYQTVIVSETPFFLKSSLSTVTDAPIVTMSLADYTKEYAEKGIALSGYGLYVFDGITPTVLPSDGAVWLINTQNVDNAGFSVKDNEDLKAGAPLVPTTSSSTLAKKLTADLLGGEIYITKYIRCGLYRNFTTLYSYKGDPVIFAGTNDYGNREVVFAFNLHDSNLPLLLDFSLLIRNMFSYSFPNVVEDVSYYCGEMMEVNVIANCKSIRVESPSGEVAYLDISETMSRYLVTEVGVHTVTVTVEDTERVYYVNAELPKEERGPLVMASDFSLQGTASRDGFDGKFDSIVLLLILLAVLFIADWGVYCYERHQLQ